MTENKKRMLLFGPGFGHNVEAKLRSLNVKPLFDVVFFAYRLDDSFREKYSYIEYVPIDYTSSIFILDLRHPWQLFKSIFRLYKEVKSYGKFDVVYSLGMEGLIGCLMFLFANKEAKKATEIWSTHLIVSAKRNSSFWDKLNRFVIRRSDLICQFWWGVRELFVQNFPEYENRFLMYQLSYPDIFFSEEKHSPESDFVKDFLNRIPKNQIVCFWPRSFIPSNNHKLLLDSLGIIKKECPDLIDNFKLYLWGGNVEKGNSRTIIDDAIKDNSLKEYVQIVNHPFVPQNDIFAIEERSDFFVQIANNDVLSTYIMEILCSGKPFVISNLRTFQFLNEKYGLEIDFVENNAQSIAERIKQILIRLRNTKVIDYRRREICKLHFSKSNTKPFAHILYEKL